MIKGLFYIYLVPVLGAGVIGYLIGGLMDLWEPSWWVCGAYGVAIVLVLIIMFFYIKAVSCAVKDKDSTKVVK